MPVSAPVIRTTGVVMGLVLDSARVSRRFG
jgi:hypothetical protein